MRIARRHSEHRVKCDIGLLNAARQVQQQNTVAAVVEDRFQPVFGPPQFGRTFGHTLFEQIVCGLQRCFSPFFLGDVAADGAQEGRFMLALDGELYRIPMGRAVGVRECVCKLPGAPFRQHLLVLTHKRGCDFGRQILRTESADKFLRGPVAQ